MAEFESIEFKIRGNADNAATSLTAFATALSKIEDKSGTLKAIASALTEVKEAANGFQGANFQKFATALGDFSNSISGLSGKVNKMTNVANSLKRFESLNNIKFGKSVGDGIRNVADAVSNISEDTFAAIGKTASSLRQLSTIGDIKISSTIGNNIKKIADAVNEISGETIQKIFQLTSALSRLRGIDLSGFSGAVRTAQKMQGGGKQVKSGSFEEASRVSAEAAAQAANAAKAGMSWEELVGKASKVVGVLTTIASVAKRAAQALWSLGKRVSIRIESATLGKLKDRLDKVSQIFRSLGRIAFYRAIRAAIKAVTQAFQEGLKNAYLFSAGLSNAIDGRIATALDNLASKSLTMKNQLGAAFGSLLTALAPIINALIGLITSLANAITMLFAAFSGGTFLKAKDTTAEFAEKMKAGGGAAKEWKNQLMGFDEINKLNDQNGGGGGGGSSALNPNDMYEVMQIPEGIQNFVDNLKAAINAGDWKGAGELLGSKFNTLVANIPWRTLGEKLGYGLNGAIQTMYHFLKEANFYTLGWSIAQFVNSAIEQIDFEVWGRLIIAKITSALDWLMGFLGGLNWGQIGAAIGNFLRGALSEATEWIQSKDWEQVAINIKDKLNEFIDGLQPDETKESLRTFLKTALDAAFTFIDELFPDGIIPTIASAIGNFFTKVASALSDEDFQVAHNILQYKIDHALFGDFADWWWSQGDYAGKDIIMGLKDGVKTEGTSFSQTLDEAVKKPTEDTFNGTREAIDNITGETYTIIDSKYGDYTSAVSLHSTQIMGYNQDVANSVSDVGGAFDGMADAGADAMGQLNGSVSEGATATGSWLDWLAQKASSLWSLLGSISFGGGGSVGWSGGGITGRASGGFVQSGQLFVARENGMPEMVGSFGGQTAVANNDMIVNGIREGVFEAVTAAMSGGNSGTPIIINLDGKEIARTTTKYQNQMARAKAV